MPPSPSIENPSTIGRIGPALWQGWEWVLQACFALLCLRFLIVAIWEDPAARLSTLLIVTGSSLLGYWRPTAALFAFTALVPFISGLTQTALLPGKAPLAIVFAALWLGMSINRRPAQEKFGCVNPSIPALAINLFASIILLSLAGECLAQLKQPDFIACLKNQSWQAYSSPYYSLTSAFIWLQGIFYIKKLLTRLQLSIKNREHLLFNQNQNSSCARPALIIHGFTMILFFSIQYRLGIPEGWAGAGYQAPYEDISSFGSAAVLLFVFLGATLRKDRTPLTLLTVALFLSATLLLSASWSRAAWLAGITGCALIIYLRTSWAWRISIIASIACFPFIINKFSTLPAWQHNSYLSRLGSLTRFEKPMSKDPNRLNLYIKSLYMIKDHPIWGHGIGSFYLKSVNYAREEDPTGEQAAFAHNVILQIAAEVGLPAGVLFTGLCCWALWRGLRTWLKMRGAQGPPSSHALLVLGVTLSLGAYLQTQMTANSLNVYISNQFFFWFMMAALLSLTAADEKAPQVNDEHAGPA